jgi:hypothetical protein
LFPLFGRSFPTRRSSDLVLGINLWIKPMKFAASIAIYLWTLGWLLRYLPEVRRLKRVVRIAVPAIMFIEITIIAGQAARGARSHFNIETPINAALFQLMGLLIVVNTFIVLAVCVQFFRQKISLPLPYLMGIRLGLALFVLGSFEGVVMSLNMAHAVGIPDGGPGLPLLNWSTQGGDLRAAHAAGLHAMQVLPLIGYGVSRLFSKWPPAGQAALVVIAGVLYLGAFVLLLREALAGRPMITA